MSRARKSNGAQKKGEAVAIKDVTLPRAVVGRLVKRGLPDGTNIQKDALTAVGKSSMVFVNFLISIAHELARARGRKTVSTKDVLDALSDMEYPEFIPQLQAELAKHEAMNLEKKAAALSDKDDRVELRPIDKVTEGPPRTKKARVGEISHQATVVPQDEQDSGNIEDRNTDSDLDNSDSGPGVTDEEELLEDPNGVTSTAEDTGSRSETGPEPDDEALDSDNNSD